MRIERQRDKERERERQTNKQTETERVCDCSYITPIEMDMSTVWKSLV